MRALVTGSQGFVGRHLVKRLIADGYFVIGVDDLSAGIAPKDEYSRTKFCFLRGDVRKYFEQWSCDDANVDRVFHCAAVVGGRLKIEGDPIGVATDLAIDSDLFNWLVRAKKPPKKVVYFSSSAVYPVCLQTPAIHPKLCEAMVNFDTQRLGTPDLTYGWAKLTGEYLAQHAARTYGLDVVIYRPFSGYGHDQSFDYPFPSVIRRVVRKEDPICIWGSGDQQRDFIHIDDVVEAVFSTMNQLKPGEVLNLGSGLGTSFQQLATAACGLLKHYPKIQPDLTKPEGVFCRVADTYKLSWLFTPKISLSEGILECAHWLTQVDKAPEKV